MMQSDTTETRPAWRGLFVGGLTVVVALLGWTGPAIADGEVALERFEVQLWPDFDKPEVLVMYRARLVADIGLPAQVGFRIPASVGDPHAVAYRAEGGRLLMAEHSREVDGDWATIRITAESRDVQLEYYAPILSIEGKRAFSYRWPGDMKVAEFVYGAQQPAAAGAFEVEPPATDQVTRNDGLVVHTADLGAIAAGQEVEIQVSYESDGTLSAKPAPKKSAPRPRRRAPKSGSAPASRAPSTASVGGEDSDWLIWLVLGLTIAAGAVWVVYAGRK